MNISKYLAEIAEKAGQSSPIFRAVAEIREQLTPHELNQEILSDSDMGHELVKRALETAKELVLADLRNRVGQVAEGREQIQSKKVFIVYDPEDLSSKAQANSLAELLRERGHLVELDAGSPEQNRRALQGSDFTLVLCGKNHTEAIYSPGKGHREIKWGHHLAVQDIYEQGAFNNNVIPVVVQEADREEVIPLELRAWTSYGLGESGEKSLDDLLRRIENRPKVVAAPLGPPKFF